MHFQLQYPLTLHNVKLTTSVDDFSPNPYLKAPYIANIITNTGVYLDSVRGTSFGKEAITIGDPGSSGYLNHFSHMKYGVNANSSNFAVFSNSFDSLEGRTTTSFAAAHME